MYAIQSLMFTLHEYGKICNISMMLGYQVRDCHKHGKMPVLIPIVYVKQKLFFKNCDHS